jgi:hypothetical protein
VRCVLLNKGDFHAPDLTRLRGSRRFDEAGPTPIPIFAQRSAPAP